MTKRLLPFAALLAVLGLQNVASGHDVSPAPWRGQPGTTLQEWDFANNSQNPSPSTVNNAYGTPTLNVSNFVFGTGWYNTQAGFGTNQGFWDIANDGAMRLTIPGLPSPDHEDIQIQVTYWADINQAPHFTFSPLALQIGPTVTYPWENPAGLGAWFVDVSLWRVTPGQSQDFITLLGDPTFGSVIDHIIVERFPVPEPSAVSLTVLVTGGIAGWILRRRKSAGRSC